MSREDALILGFGIGFYAGVFLATGLYAWISTLPICRLRHVHYGHAPEKQPGG